jgi:hypothetical protein
MEPNLQNTPVQQAPPIIPAKHTNLLPMIVVGFVMLILGLGGGYLLFANKSTPKQPTTTVSQVTPTSAPTTNQTIITSAPTQANNTCGTEGTAADASVTDPNNSSGVDNRPKELNASKKWENDAYLVTQTKSISLKDFGDPTFLDIYASSCSTDYLTYWSNPNEEMQVTHQKMNFIAQSYLKTIDYFTSSLIINTLQFPFNQAITPAQRADWDAGKIPNFPWFVNNTPQSTGPITDSDLMPLVDNININGAVFSADWYTIQLNNSKKQGLFYDVVFASATQKSGTCPNNICTFKISALATADTNGKLLSFKKY